MRIRHEDDDSDVSINLTPMIDIVLQLLSFFMLATTFVVVEKELDVDLPTAESGRGDEAIPDELVINVMRDGRLIVAGRTLDEGALGGALARAAERDKQTPVTI